MKKGFTLIELLVVVLIIGILSAVALPQYRKAVLKSRFATIKNLAKSLADAQKIYYMANGEYSFDLTALDIQLPGTLSSSDNSNINFPWGVCYIACENASCGGCLLNENGKSQIGYFYTNFKTDARTCFVYADSDQAYIDICKAETGKSSGRAEGSSITHYDY